MTTPYYNPQNTSTPPSFAQASQPATPSTRGRGGTTTGAKRGRKPKGALNAGQASPRPFITNTFSANAPSAATSSTGGSTSTFSATPGTGSGSAQYPRVHWAMPTASGDADSSTTTGTTAAGSSTTGVLSSATGSTTSLQTDSLATAASQLASGQLDASTILSNLQSSGQLGPLQLGPSRTAGYDEDVEIDDELLPAMADDDYSAQLSFQSQSKDNLKVLMDHFSPAQYDRFEAYRRHALPKQAVRKAIQQTCGQQVSQPVAQIIAGFAKVFVGEIVEKARAVQKRRGETGPLSPDHLREAYRAYQQETGNVGAARPLRSKKLFVR